MSRVGILHIRVRKGEDGKNKDVPWAEAACWCINHVGPCDTAVQLILLKIQFTITGHSAGGGVVNPAMEPEEELG